MSISQSVNTQGIGRKKFKSTLHEKVFTYILERKDASIDEINKKYGLGGSNRVKKLVGEIKNTVEDYGFRVFQEEGNICVRYAEFGSSHRTESEIVAILQLGITNLPRDVSSYDIEDLAQKQQVAKIKRSVLDFLTCEENRGKPVIDVAIMQECNIVSKKVLSLLIQEIQDSLDEGKIIREKNTYTYYTQKTIDTLILQYHHTLKNKEKEQAVEERLYNFFTDDINAGVLFSIKTLSKKTQLTHQQIQDSFKTVKKWLERSDGYTFRYIVGVGYIFGSKAEVLEKINEAKKSQKQENILARKSQKESEKKKTEEAEVKKLKEVLQRTQGKFFFADSIADTLNISISKARKLLHVLLNQKVETQENIGLFFKKRYGYFYGTQKQYLETKKKEKAKPVREKGPTLKDKYIKFIESSENHEKYFTIGEITEQVGGTENSFSFHLHHARKGLKNDIKILYVKGKGYIFGNLEYIENLKKDLIKLNEQSKKKEVIEKGPLTQKLITYFQENEGKIFDRDTLCTTIGMKKSSFSGMMKEAYETLNADTQEEQDREEVKKLVYIHRTGYIYADEKIIQQHKIQTTPQKTINQKGLTLGEKIYNYLSNEENIGKVIPRQRILSDCGVSESSFPSHFKKAKNICREKNPEHIIANIPGVGFVYCLVKEFPRIKDKYTVQTPKKNSTGNTTQPYHERARLKNNTPNYSDKFKEIEGLFSPNWDMINTSLLDIDFIEQKIENIALSNDQFFLCCVLIGKSEVSIESLKSTLKIDYETPLLKEYLILLRAQIHNNLKGICDIKITTNNISLQITKKTLKTPQKSKEISQQKQKNELDSLIFQLCSREKGLSYKDLEDAIGKGSSVEKIESYIRRVNKKYAPTGIEIVLLEDSGIYKAQKIITGTKQIKGKKTDSPTPPVVPPKTEVHGRNGMGHGEAGNGKSPVPGVQSMGQEPKYQPPARIIKGTRTEIGDCEVPQFSQQQIEALLKKYTDVYMNGIQFENDKQKHFFFYLLSHRGKWISKEEIYKYLSIGGGGGIEDQLIIFQLKGSINNRLGLSNGHLHIQNSKEEGFRIPLGRSKNTKKVEIPNRREYFEVCEDQETITYHESGKSIRIPLTTDSMFHSFSRLLLSPSKSIHMKIMSDNMSNSINDLLFKLNIPYKLSFSRLKGGRVTLKHKMEALEAMQKDKKLEKA